MINQYVIEGKCIMQPFADVDENGRSYAQINIESNHGIVCTRAYNAELINNILNDVEIYDNLLITGFIGSTSKQGALIMVLHMSEFSVL